MILTPPLAAYPYAQYNDDDDIVAFFIAYNAMAQQYIDFFNTYNLADYRSPLINGALMDWCVDGIYGVSRPFLVRGSIPTPMGPYGTFPDGKLYYGEFVDSTGSTSYSFANDDIYSRVVTWNFFKGDGVNFNIKWLKRRVIRFLTGVDNPEDTYDVSISFSGVNLVTIEVPTSNPLSDTLLSLVRSNIVSLPFQYAFTVNLV